MQPKQQQPDDSTTVSTRFVGARQKELTRLIRHYRVDKPQAALVRVVHDHYVHLYDAAGNRRPSGQKTGRSFGFVWFLVGAVVGVVGCLNW